jgi:hypothetical protein
MLVTVTDPATGSRFAISPIIFIGLAATITEYLTMTVLNCAILTANTAPMPSLGIFP